MLSPLSCVAVLGVRDREEDTGWPNGEETRRAGTDGTDPDT